MMKNAPPVEPEPLTADQRRALEVLENRELTEGSAPSVRQLARELNVTVGAAQARLDHLVTKGWIERTGKRNGITILHRLRPLQPAGRPQPTASILLAGKIPAGRAIEAIEDDQRWIDVPYGWTDGRPCYFLQVEGDSMADLIFNRDWVLVRREGEFVDGKVYVCILPDTNEATLKHVHKIRGGYRLVPANPAYEPIVVKKLELRGRVVKIIRDVE